jgi:hypothetical protein
LDTNRPSKRAHISRPLFEAPAKTEPSILPVQPQVQPRPVQPVQPQSILSIQRPVQSQHRVPQPILPVHPRVRRQQPLQPLQPQSPQPIHPVQRTPYYT